VHLVGFIIKKSVTMHGHMNVKFLQESLVEMSLQAVTDKTASRIIMVPKTSKILFWKIFRMK